MTITVGKYGFEGPFQSIDELENKSGVYAIHDSRDSKFFIGESKEIRDRVK